MGVNDILIGENLEQTFIFVTSAANLMVKPCIAAL